MVLSARNNYLFRIGALSPMPINVLLRAVIAASPPKAFSSEVNAGSREENASKQKSGAVSIASER